MVSTREKRPIQQLLRLSTSLKNLPLKQLVTVHKALINTIDLNYQDRNFPADGDNEFDHLIKHLVGDEDETFSNIFQDGGLPQQKLLLVQYLLHGADGLSRLTQILLPLLSQQFIISQLNGEELRETILSAVFDDTIISNDEASKLNTNFLKGLPFIWACRILARLHSQCCVEKLVLHETIAGMQQLETLRPVTAWLLPLLLEKNPSSFVIDSIWKECLILIELTISEDNEKNDAPLIVSSILCACFPYFLSADMPLPTKGDDRLEITQQSELWCLLSYLLHRGCARVNDDSACGQTLRRRGLYILRLLVESKEFGKFAQLLWVKYVACFETLEMETEQHLIDQVWGTVAELCVQASLDSKERKLFSPSITWEWIATMLSRILLCDTPVLRRLGLYRFLNGDVGIQIEVGKQLNQGDAPSHQGKKYQKQRATKGQKRNSKTIQQAPLAMVPTDFVLDVVITSFDTLGSSIGTKIKMENESKIQVHDISPKLTSFILTYTQVIDNQGLEKFLEGVLSPYLGLLRSKTAVLLLEAIAEGLKLLPSGSLFSTEEALLSAIVGFQNLFCDGAVIITHRKRLLCSFAIILSKSIFRGQMGHKTILQVLSLFLDIFEEEQIDPTTQAALQLWIKKIGNSSDWASRVAEACAASFVQMGLLSQFRGSWNPMVASNDFERKMGAAIVFLASLSDEEGAASSLLWPAVHKGLRGQSPSSATAWYNADKASRAMIILENGCKMEILSGLGNGDIVVDKKTQQMLPPPPNVENLLTTAVEFLMNHIHALSSSNKNIGESVNGVTGTGAHSINTNQVSATFAKSIMQIRVFAESYPSSFAVSSASEQILESSVQAITSLDDEDSLETVTATSLLYAALSCGANPGARIKNISTFEICAKLLRLDIRLLQEPISAKEKQVACSVFHYARWGCLSIILPKLMAKADSSEASKISDVLDHIPSRALDLVEETPIDALLPLFDCVRGVANSWLPICGDSSIYPSYLSRTINALFSAMDDVSASRTSTYMLNQICSLIFRPELLYDEYRRLQEDSNYQAPIRSAFLKLKKMSSKARSYVLRAAVCYICAGWLGSGNSDGIIPGIGAVPYVNEIAELLTYKGKKIDELETKKSVLMGSEQESDTGLLLPPETDETSIVRGFLMLFISRLPGSTEGLDERVLKGLLHPLIVRIIEEHCFAPLKSGSSLMFGSVDYSLRIRSWQALCILSRYVSSEIAEFVCDSIFKALSQQLHGKIRYFLEVFAIQFARQHPTMFFTRFVEEISNVGLSLQQVSSLMVIGGNVIVGNYKVDFFRQLHGSDEENKEKNTLQKILRGVVPWLSSTQGFSRAIAQLLVYSLIPLVIDVSQFENDQPSDCGNDWYLCRIYHFLDQNPDMKRLRKKQTKSFGGYDVDNVCDINGLLSIKVDEGDEANPEHMVDLIKKSLEEAHIESREKEIPKWKHVEKLMLQKSSDDSAGDGCTDVDGNDKAAFHHFQRKISPLDTLDLGLQQSREVAMQNACGRKRQSLIVCASLVDKIPNLGGLSRTAEIFAADRLVIPDMSVVKTELFKSLSVGAGNWVPMEQCREDDLFKWLSTKQQEGYTIVGLEQTSSSKSIEKYEFPKKTVLLLGKEKEGIPVEFLQLVDQCIEIPQLGIIRSLNVHVSAAICIWEYSKQHQHLALKE